MRAPTLTAPWSAGERYAPPDSTRPRSPATPIRIVRAGLTVPTATVWLTYAATFYPFLLCFLNTRVATMPNASIIVCEVLIATAALPVLATRINVGLLLLALCVCANFLLLSAFQEAIDFKELRDLLFPLLFVWLGFLLADRVRSERVLRTLAILAVAFGLAEYFFPTLYARFFDTIAFYTSRGFAGNNPFALTVLQVRPTGIGRSLFAFLGPRRMSSFFIEPVALGNFGVMIAAWALAKPKEEWKDALGLMALAAVVIVLGDARFGSITILVLCAIRLTGLWRIRVVAALLPIAAMLMLVLTAFYGPAIYRDDIVGRFQVSGWNLISMDWTQWLGLPGWISMDAGYGYIVQRTGVAICALLWFFFATMPFADDQARRFHFNIACFASLNLCISGSSLFSLKTTAVLWLLLGTVLARGASTRRTSTVSDASARRPQGSPIAGIA